MATPAIKNQAKHLKKISVKSIKEIIRSSIEDDTKPSATEKAD